MRKLLLIIVLTLFLLPSTKALAFTTDSEITPEELFKWPAVYYTMPDTDGIYYIISENPNLRTPITTHIKYILVRVDNNKLKMTGYAYYKYSTLYIFELESTNDSLKDGHFKRMPVTSQKKKLIDHFLKPYLASLPPSQITNI